MRALTVTAALLLLALPATAFAQTYTDLASYCKNMSEVSTATLLARVRGWPRSQAEGAMRGMTDPLAIRMVKEVLDFAYSRSTTTNLDVLRTELRNLCLEKKIFVQ